MQPIALWRFPTANSIVMRLLNNLPLVRPSPKNEIMPPYLSSLTDCIAEPVSDVIILVGQ